MNKVILVGNISRDLEFSKTQAGISCCKMTIAVNRNYKDADGKTQADFFNCIAWRGLADNCNRYLSKGSKVAISGMLQNRSYEDNNGTKRYATEIVLDDCEFISTPKKDEQQHETRAEQAAMDIQPSNKKKTVEDLKPVDDSDLPF